ncbi:MAG TPA: hypothetical protein VFU48_05970, partial [Nitrospira sp.]|nr:hypothetical protein [Nitrospira sp.]
LDVSIGILYTTTMALGIQGGIFLKDSIIYVHLASFNAESLSIKELGKPHDEQKNLARCSFFLGYFRKQWAAFVNVD